MQLKLLALALLAPTVHALLRFSCSQLVVERLDPLVNPGEPQSPHLHQIIGGDAFNTSMDPNVAPSDLAKCTTCTFAEDFRLAWSNSESRMILTGYSNYWTAVLFFRARNGTFKRVPQKGNVGFEQSQGGMTIYYTPTLSNGAAKGAVTAFKKGFRMIIGNNSLMLHPSEILGMSCKAKIIC